MAGARWVLQGLTRQALGEIFCIFPFLGSRGPDILIFFRGFKGPACLRFGGIV